jgi:flagellar basal body rod protein FlgG
MPRAEGLFDVKRVPEAVHDKAEGLLARHTLDKHYRGALDATGIGEMLSAGTQTPGSAGYVAIEKVAGTLDGRTGSFYLQHSGTLTRGQGSLVIHVIPDSGAGDLTGLSGTMQIVIADGKHSYIFDYELG